MATIDLKEENGHFFSISIRKLLLLSVLTLGLYNLCWFYKNWRYIEEHEPNKPWWARTNPSPVVGAILSIFYYYPLLRRIQAQANAYQVAGVAHPILIALVYFVLGALAKSNGPESLLTMLSFMLLLPAQQAVNRMNAEHGIIPTQSLRLQGRDIKVLVVCWAILAIFIYLATR